eukprot:m.345143 g.345143  ORF g.345143 m.345143 type:complete len:589 (-) comp25778_c0_seq1:142-1908(-)
MKFLVLAAFGVFGIILLNARQTQRRPSQELQPQTVFLGKKKTGGITNTNTNIPVNNNNDKKQEEVEASHNYPFFQRCDSPKHKGFRGWKCNKFCMGDPYGVNTCSKLFKMCLKNVDCRCHPDELEEQVDPYFCHPQPKVGKIKEKIVAQDEKQVQSKKKDILDKKESLIEENESSTSTSDASSLHPDWVPPPSCLRSADTAPDPSEKFLVVLNVGMPGEQQSKNIGAVALMANIARKLGRTLVEPATCNGYIASPFEDAKHAPEPLQRAAEVHRMWGSCKKKVGLSAIWDLSQACQQVKIMPLRQFQQLAHPSKQAPWGKNFTGDDYRCIPTSCKFHTAHRIFRRIQPDDIPEDGRVVYVYAFQRELDHLGQTGLCTTKECYGLKFSVPLPLTRYVRDISSRVGHYACINWRTETRLNHYNVNRCVDALLATLQRAITSHQSNKATATTRNETLFLLLSDLLPGHSMSYKRSNPQTQAIKAIEKFLLGEGNKIAKSGVAGGSDAARLVLEAAAMHDVDLGVTARIQQLLCANADYIVGLNNDAGRHRRFCGRGVDSGFVAGMIHAREQLGRSMEINATNGFYPFYDEY